MSKTTGQRIYTYRKNRKLLSIGGTTRVKNKKGLFRITEFETNGKYTLIGLIDERGNGWHMELRNLFNISKTLT